jgi:hypothetical protein
VERDRDQRSSRRRSTLLLAGAIATLTVGVPAASPQQGPGTPDFALFVSYRITSVPSAPSGVYRARGTFSTTGTVTDSGTATLSYRITARGPDTVRGVETLRGARGTAVVRFQASAVPVGKRKLNERPGPTRIFGVGVSRVASGTRAYTALRADVGTMGYSIDFSRRTTSSLHTFR